MNRILLTSVVFLIVGVVVTGVRTTRPASSEHGDLAFWTLPDLARQIEENQRRQAELDRQLEEIQRLFARRQEVVADLVARRITLLEAAEIFGELNTRLPNVGHLPKGAFPGKTYEEQVCRQVIQWTYQEMLSVSRAAAEREAERLRADLDEYLESQEIP